MENRFITGPNVISVIVTLGFFISLFLFMFRPIAITSAEAWSILNIMIGSLGTMFAAVVQYQIGSTRSSKEKDDTIRSMASTASGMNGTT
jgi:uncharacterized YccA/Bax inhibitor family protein